MSEEKDMPKVTVDANGEVSHCQADIVLAVAGSAAGVECVMSSGSVSRWDVLSVVDGAAEALGTAAGEFGIGIDTLNSVIATALAKGLHKGRMRREQPDLAKISEALEQIGF